jgi:hypothetical protein
MEVDDGKCDVGSRIVTAPGRNAIISISMSAKNMNFGRSIFDTTASAPPEAELNRSCALKLVRNQKLSDLVTSERDGRLETAL